MSDDRPGKGPKSAADELRGEDEEVRPETPRPDQERDSGGGQLAVDLEGTGMRRRASHEICESRECFCGSREVLTPCHVAKREEVQFGSRRPCAGAWQE